MPPEIREVTEKTIIVQITKKEKIIEVSIGEETNVPRRLQLRTVRMQYTIKLPRKELLLRIH